MRPMARTLQFASIFYPQGTDRAVCRFSSSSRSGIMTDLLETLVAVFDGEKARFFKYQADGHLRATAEMQAGLHRFSREAISDKQGRSFATAKGGIRHSYEQKHDQHKMEKHNFVHRLVATLDDAYDQGAYRHLIVVAPERALGEFRSIASPKLRKIVLKELAKELTQYSEAELEQRLHPILEAEARSIPPEA
jgi:protein required for attachment to host cells